MQTNGLGIQLGEIVDQPSFRLQHLLAWVGGMLCALVPFFGYWKVGPMNFEVHFGSGNFGFNLLIFSALCMVGGTLGGYWWRLCKWMLGRNDRILTFWASLLFVVGLLGSFTTFLHPWFFYLIGGILFAGLFFSFINRDARARRVARNRWGWYEFGAWLAKPTPWNAVFFALLFLVVVINNITLAWGLDLSMMAKLELILSRMLTQVVLVGGVFLLSEITMRAAPKYFRWVPWSVFALFPFLIIADQLIGMLWSRPLINIVNVMTQSGSFKPEVELAAGGIVVSPLMAKVILLGAWLLAGLVAVVCLYISKRLKTKISLRTALLVMFGAWIGLIAEQGIASSWQNVSDRQMAHQAFAVNIGFFNPPDGVGTYRVSFYPSDVSLVGKLPPLENKPDIFIFMIESTRADAIRPDVAPFLSQFKDNECQELGQTWSGANATHLSWFSFFHSRIPVFWREDHLKDEAEKTNAMGSEVLQCLKKAGYRIEVRAVCNLSYKSFGLSNFGYGKNLADVVLQENGEIPEYGEVSTPERERMCFGFLKESVKARPHGGGFYYTAMDSPHYNYYWADDFEPPFKDYYRSTDFPFNPTEEEVKKVQYRYWNAIAWTDSLIADFVKFLKEEGRYDESIIIVLGDHGEEFQEQGSWFHCSSLQPEQTHVPILIKWPRSMGRGPVQHSASQLDVMPSVLSALGMPASDVKGMAGRNLLGKTGDFTSIVTTAYPGVSGITMMLHRNGYHAAFSWKHYWEAKVPKVMVLEYITDPKGKRISLSSPEAYKKELQKLFPDAFERFFKSLDVIK